MRDPNCALCALLPWGACDFHAHETREHRREDECERPADAPTVDWLVPMP